MTDARDSGQTKTLIAPVQVAHVDDRHTVVETVQSLFTDMGFECRVEFSHPDLHTVEERTDEVRNKLLTVVARALHHTSEEKNADTYAPRANGTDRDQIKRVRRYNISSSQNARTEAAKAFIQDCSEYEYATSLFRLTEFASHHRTVINEGELCTCAERLREIESIIGTHNGVRLRATITADESAMDLDRLDPVFEYLTRNEETLCYVNPKSHPEQLEQTLQQALSGLERQIESVKLQTPA